MNGGVNTYVYVLGSPLNYIDSSGLAPGDPYPNAVVAGKQALRGINPTSIAQGLEYAGRIYKNPDGTYSYTRPNRGTKDSSSTGLCPAGTTDAGDCHTHGANDPEYDNENFSITDKAANDSGQLPGFLGTPNGDIKIYIPIAGKPLGGIVMTIGKGAK